MGVVDELWQLHLDMTPDYKEPLFVSLTGGMDSRLLAGILRFYKDIEIDLGVYFYREEEYNLPHIKKLVDILGYKNFEFIKRNGRDRWYEDSWRRLNEKYDLKKYVYVSHKHGLQNAGALISSSKRNMRWWAGHYTEIDEIENSLYRFKKTSYPYANPYYVGFCYAMPKWYRFKHNAHIQMLKKYLPQIADVSLCSDYKGIQPIKTDWCVLRKIVSQLKPDQSVWNYMDLGTVIDDFGQPKDIQQIKGK